MISLSDLPTPTYDERGLLPGIVQDTLTGQVLMLGWLNAESLALSLSTGQVHFWSRSRGEIWRKGETSGNTLTLESISVDCDSDTLLIGVRPAGPTCHTGTVSCFDGATSPDPRGFGALEGLWATICQRLDQRPDGSYTVSLVDAGVDVTARKVTEEATEVLMAAKDHAAGAVDDTTRITEETADLVYHLLVLLAERGVDPRSVMEELRNRG